MNDTHATTPAPTTQLGGAAMTWLDAHLAIIKNKMIQKALDFVSANGQEETVAIAHAAELYAPGYPIARSPEPTFLNRVSRSITGVTLISAVLAVLFGIMSYVESYLGHDAKGAENLIDIAKIFAGAVVGSVGASTASAARDQPRPAPP